MLGDVFIDTSRHQLLDAQLHLALLGIDSEHERLDDLADAQNFCRLADPLFGADLADVDHSFHAFGKLHEGAEFHQARYRTFDFRSHRKTLGHIDPRIAERLFESERDAVFFGIQTENHGFNGLTGLYRIAGLSYFGFGP